MIARLTDTVWQAAVFAVTLFVLFAGKPAHAQGTTALAPFQTNLTIGTSATLAAVPANPSRRGLIICNGHATQTITVGFGSNTPVSGTSGLVIPGGNAVASCWYALPNVGISPSVGIGAAINIIASGASTPVTVMEF